MPLGSNFQAPGHASSLPLGGGLKQYGYQVISKKSILFYHFTPSKFETCRIEVETTGQGTESLPSSSCTRSLPPGLPGPFVFNYLTGRRTESEDRIASTSYAKAIALQMSVFTKNLSTADDCAKFTTMPLLVAEGLDV